MDENRVKQIMAELEKLYPEARPELNFSNPFEVLIATILSAQCTDKRVNMVTARLFPEYPDAYAMSKLEPEQLEPMIRECGLYRNKAKNVVRGWLNAIATGSTANRIPENVSDRQILQWKRQCESEIAKRGLQFHDIGHGWASKAFGFDEDFRKRITAKEIGAPQEVYDDPTNLFVAKFLGTPPINVFEGTVRGEKLYVGEAAVLDVPGVKDQPVYVGIRPEGFVVDPNGALTCNLSGVDVMGRDVSLVTTHTASLNPVVRSIVDADAAKNASGITVSYSLKPHKVFLFNKETEERVYFEVK